MPTALLFLIADTGGGHRASANAVRSQIELAWPGKYEIHVVDPFAQGAPVAIKRTTDLYGPIIQNARWLWGGLYHATNSRAAVAALRGSVLRPVERAIARLVREIAPAAVVSFHPLLNHITARVVRRDDVARVPVITVITDLVDVHASWACRDIDAVVTPSPGGMDRCRRAGIPAGKVYELGLPVHPSFVSPALSDAGRLDLRQTLGLDGSRFLVLLCGGADGSGGIARRAQALASAPLDIELAVICGRNRRTQNQLAGLRDHLGRPVAVHGFVSNMADWVRAADVIVTKAGPGTIAEALCCGTPLLLSWYLPGQEHGNVEWVVDSGAGRYTPSVGGLIDTVAELAEPESEALATMRGAVAFAARPSATAEIAALVTRYATEGVR